MAEMDTSNGHKSTSDSLVSAKDALDQYKQQMNVEAIRLLREEFPRRILQLNELYYSPDLTNVKRCYVDVNVPRPPPEGVEGPNFLVTGTVDDCKILMLPDGVVESNPIIIELQEMIKPIILQLSQDCNTLRLWIQFLIPKVEDGNNFGVGIQEECLEDVIAVEKDSMNQIDRISRYLAARGNIISKICKYPHVEDYRRALVELDEKEFYSIRLCVSQLRNDYSVMQDIIFKNLEKIQKPRNSNAQNLY